MIFLTVGTQFPFDRLVRGIDNAMDKGLISEKLFGQIGQSSYKPRNFEAVAHLERETFDKYVRQASAIIGHAGIGTIMLALNNQKPLLVMPRLKKFSEVVNNHQFDIAKKFAQLGYLLVAYDIEDLADIIPKLKNFTPRKRETNSAAVADRVSCFLNSLIFKNSSTD